MKRIMKQMIAALILLILCCGCGATSSAESTANLSDQSLIDCAGRKVTLPQDKDRIACLYAYTGHVAVLLNCEDRIAAVVDGLKRDRLMQLKVPNLDSLSCPYKQGAINIEELTAADPDMIFLRASNLQDAGELEKLEKLGIPYIVIEYETMEEQMRSIEVMGKALDRKDAAEAYLSYYESTIDMIKERLAQLPESEKKTIYHSINEVVRTDIPDTLSYEVLEAAGCINVVNNNDALTLDGEKGYVTVEQIYLWDPDIILANEPSAVEYFQTDEKFSGLRAVRENQVYQLPVGLSRWAHPGSVESPLAALYIATTLYPDYFSDIDINEEIREFYNTFFRVSLTDEDIATILCGQGMRTPREEATHE